MLEPDVLTSDLRDRLLSVLLDLADRPELHEDLLNGLDAVRQSIRDYELDAAPSLLNARADIRDRIAGLEALASHDPDDPSP